MPVVATLPNDGLSIEARTNLWKMTDDPRVTHRIGIPGRVAWSPQGGSLLASVGISVPHLAPGWRLKGELSAGRYNRWGWYGLGNTTGIDPGLQNDDARYYYRVRRHLYTAYVDVTRRIAGPVGVSLQLGGARGEFEALPGPSLWRQQVGGPVDQWEGTARLALEIDQRDTEYDTRSGWTAEAGYQLGTGAGESFGRWHAVLRGWVPLAPSSTLAARLYAADLNGTPTIFARELLPAWENPFSVLGGEESMRVISFGRLHGRGILGANLEYRQMLEGRARDWGGLGLLAFFDAGRAFEEEPFKLTLDDWIVGIGGGVAIKIGRGTIIVITGGVSGREAHGGFRTGWMF